MNREAVESRVYQGAQVCLALLVAVNAMHFTRVLGGIDSPWAWLIAVTLMIALATVDSMQGSLISRARTETRIGWVCAAIAVIQVCCHSASVWTSQMAFSVASHEQMHEAAEETAEAHLRRSAINQSIRLSRELDKAKSGRERAELAAQYEAAAARAERLQPQSAMERALGGADNADEKVKWWSLCGALMLTMLSFGLALGKGAWLAGSDQADREQEASWTPQTKKPDAPRESRVTPEVRQRVRDRMARRQLPAAAATLRDPREATTPVQPKPPQPDTTDDLVGALKSLGWSARDAQAMAAKAPGDGAIEARLRAALASTLAPQKPKQIEVEVQTSSAPVKRGSAALQRDVAKVRDALAAGELRSVSVRAIQPIVGGGADKRRRVIATLVEEGVLERKSDGTVSVATRAAA